MIRLCLLATTLALFLAACGASGGLPAENPFMTGVVTQIQPARVLIEEAPGEQRGNKCWFDLTNKTAVFRQQGKEVLKGATADLAAGQKVSAWASGPVRESYPCQTGAAALLIF